MQMNLILIDAIETNDFDIHFIQMYDTNLMHTVDSHNFNNIDIEEIKNGQYQQIVGESTILLIKIP